MNINFIKLLLFIVLFISGCASKNEREFLSEISENSYKYKQLRETEKIILGNKDNQKIILLTYIFNQNKDSNEKFIISIHTDDGKNPIKKITLEGYSHLSMRDIERSLLPIGLKTVIPQWFNNYIVVFPHTNLKKFRIIITTETGVEKSIYFYKDMRYLIDKNRNYKVL